MKASEGGRVTAVETPAEAGRPAVARAALTVVAAVLFAVGWVVGKVSIPLAWCLVALKLGFFDARKAE